MLPRCHFTWLQLAPSSTWLYQFFDSPRTSLHWSQHFSLPIILTVSLTQLKCHGASFQSLAQILNFLIPISLCPTQPEKCHPRLIPPPALYLQPSSWMELKKNYNCTDCLIWMSWPQISSGNPTISRVNSQVLGYLEDSISALVGEIPLPSLFRVWGLPPPWGGSYFFHIPFPSPLKFSLNSFKS